MDFHANKQKAISLCVSEEKRKDSINVKLQNKAPQEHGTRLKARRNPEKILEGTPPKGHCQACNSSPRSHRVTRSDNRAWRGWRSQGLPGRRETVKKSRDPAGLADSAEGRWKRLKSESDLRRVPFRVPHASQKRGARKQSQPASL